MKQILTILLSVASASCFADSFIKDAEPTLIEVHYTRMEVSDTTQRDKRFTKDPVVLRIGKDKSAFFGTKKLWQDSIMAVDPASFWEMEKARIMSSNRDDSQLSSGHYWCYIYKNIPEGKVTERSYFDMDYWEYSEDWEKPQWEVGDSTRTILGYECVEATSDYRGRKWTAWFAPDIPVQEGPWKLCGLPGLILEAYDAGRDYVFEADGLIQNPNSEVGIYTYKDKHGYNKVSRDKFLNNWWKYKHSNFAAKMRAATGMGPKPSPNENKPKVVNYDKEETNYPHNL